MIIFSKIWSNFLESSRQISELNDFEFCRFPNNFPVYVFSFSLVSSKTRPQFSSTFQKMSLFGLQFYFLKIKKIWKSSSKKFSKKTVENKYLISFFWQFFTKSKKNNIYVINSKKKIVTKHFSCPFFIPHSSNFQP